MLVIRRKAGEAFHIGNRSKSRSLEVGTNQVKIGIRAPREIAVLRNEVFLTECQNKAAATAASALLSRIAVSKKA